MPRGKRSISPKRYNQRLPKDAAEATTFKGVSDLPVSSVSVPGGSMLTNATGSWRNVRPEFRDKTPPCLPRCPAGENIEGYLDLLARGKDTEAAAMLREDNPLPATCGRVCYHPCESGCNRSEWGGALSVHSVERYLGDLALRLPSPPAPKKKRGRKRAAVIGAGPAGLSCAYHLTKRGYSVTVFDREPEAGGVLRTGIPPYRLPKDVLAMEIEKIAELGVEIRTGVEVGKDISFEQLQKDYKAIFVACGFHRSRKLGIPGEDFKGVQNGLDFLRQINFGERPRLGRRVLVIGGGNTAMDCARSAMRLGSHALVVYRRTRGEMPAIPEEILEAEREGAELSFLLQPVDILGKNGKVTGVRFVRCRLGEPDSSGRRRPIPIKGAFQDYPTDAVLLATGESADLRFLPRGYVLGHNGAIIDDAGGEVEGVFAGGDLTTSVKMVSNAIGTGKVAAAVFDKYLAGTSWPEALAEIEHSPTSFAVDRLDHAGSATPRSSEVVDSTGINFSHFPRLSRAAAGKLSPAEAIRSFAEVSQGFDRATAEAEARRCFHCAVCCHCDNCFLFCPDGVVRRTPEGGYEIDLTYCKGCGICAEECPRGAISIVRESRAL